VVPCWNRFISDPSRHRRSTVLKLFYFTRGSIIKWNKIILARARSVAQAPAGAWKFPSRLPATACCRMAITVDKCSGWLQQLPHEYSCQNYFISFQTWFRVKIKLVHGQVTIILVVSVCLFVCLSVCLFVCLCRVFLSRLRSDLDQTSMSGSSCVP